MPLKILYNCFSIRKRFDKIKEMLKETDILTCQEFILLEENCHILHGFDENFYVIYVPSMHPSSQHGGGRPIGGLAIFYRKHIDISEVSRTANYQAVELCSDGDIFIMINLYMQSDNRNHESPSNYQCLLGELLSFIDSLSTDKILLMGDFNAGAVNNGLFWTSLEIFINENYFGEPDLTLPLSTFTFRKTTYKSTSWLDHVVTLKAMKTSNICIRYDLALYDHTRYT